MDSTTKPKNNMKKLLILAALIGLASCTAELNPQSKTEDVTLTVSVKSNDVLTKATDVGDPNESNVNNIQVFVFKKNVDVYVFEAAAKANANSLPITVTTGEKDVIILVNEPSDYTGLTDRNAILSNISSLADNSPSSLVMFGEASSTVTTSSHNISIPVTRLASRVTVKKITNKLRNGNATKNVKVSRVFLTNAGATSTYGFTRGGFYATTGINTHLDFNGISLSDTAEKDAVNALIYKNINADIGENASYTTPVVLYGYANDKAIKPTRLVVEMAIAGRYFTYPIELPAMAPNHTLEVTEIVITSVGNISNGDDYIDDGEDTPVTFLEATFTLNVQPWTIVTVSNETGGTNNYTI